MAENDLQAAIEINSQRYGNDKTIDEVFERETSPIPGELHETLADTAHLTEKEAFAFVHGHLDGFPPIQDVDIATEMVQDHGFKSLSEFNAIKQTAKEKVADVIWIYELIDAYRFPDIPEECCKCGGPLGGHWVENSDGESVEHLCKNCADIDPKAYL